MILQLQWFLFFSTITSFDWASCEDGVCSTNGIKCVSECNWSWMKGYWCTIDDVTKAWESCPGECPSASSYNEDTASATTTSTEAATSSTTTTTTTTAASSTTASSTTTTSQSSTQTEESTSGDSEDVYSDDDDFYEGFDFQPNVRSSDIPWCGETCNRDTSCYRYYADRPSTLVPVQCYCPELRSINNPNQDCYPKDAICSKCQANNADCAFNDTSKTYECKCERGSYGLLCNQPCDSQCQHGGTCDHVTDVTSQMYTYICACTDAWRGTYCNVPGTHCNDCKRSVGKCFDNGNHYDWCSCLAGTTGDVGCVASEEACDKCQNEVSCHRADENTVNETYKCNCASGFYGRYCEHSCASLCLNGGSCSADDSFGYICECQPNTYGAHCEYANLLLCTACRYRNRDQQCLYYPTNTGVGVSPSTSRCSCLYNSTSDSDCTSSFQACNKCNDVGTLACPPTTIPGTYRCQCKDGYYGKFCEIRCRVGYECRQDEVCEFSNTLNFFGKICVPREEIQGTSRRTIRSNLYPCDRCTRGGFCENDLGLKWCYCPKFSTGDAYCYEGSKACDKCENKDKGTNCTKTNSSVPEKEYKCHCTDGYFGLFCNTSCASHCINGGTCEAKSIVNQTNPLQYVHTFICKCVNGHYGEHCELPTTVPSGACTSNPCVGGCTCKESCMREGGYECVGNQGRLGKNCEIPTPTISCEMDKVSIQIQEPFFNIEKFVGSQFYLSKSINDAVKCEVSPIRNFKFGTPTRSFTLQSGQLERCMLQNHDAFTANYTTLLYSNKRFPGMPNIDMPVPIINFKCNYKTRYSVSTQLRPIIADVATIRKDGETVSLTIGLCKRSICNAPCPDHLQVQRDATYTIGEIIHVGIYAIHSPHMSSGGTVASLKHVYLSCSGDQNSTLNKVEIFAEGCSTKDGNRLSAQSTFGRLRLDRVCFSFRLARLKNCDTFFIHTHVRICDNPSNTCGDGSSTCPARRKRRSVNAEQEQENKIGPITVVYPQGQGQVILLETDDSQPEVVHNTKGRNVNKEPVEANLQFWRSDFWSSNLVLIAGGCLFVFGVIIVSTLFFHYTYLRQRNSLSFKH